MSKRVKIGLGIVLLLIAVQVLYASFQGIQYAQFVLSHSTSNNLGYAELIWILCATLIGALLILFAVFVFLEKKWVRIPLIIFLFLFLAYNAVGLVQTFFSMTSFIEMQMSFNEDWAKSLMSIQIFVITEYMILTILGIILAWKKK